jgi:hypothetical protein
MIIITRADGALQLKHTALLAPSGPAPGPSDVLIKPKTNLAGVRSESAPKKRRVYPLRHDIYARYNLYIRFTRKTLINAGEKDSVNELKKRLEMYVPKC